MKINIRKKCLQVLLTGTISLFSLTGCYIKAKADEIQNSSLKPDKNIVADSDKKELIYIKYKLSDVYDYCSAYKVVDSFKKIIDENNVSNVYIDINNGETLIDGIIEEYIDYINAIAKKLEANGIRFTLVGTEEQLDNFLNYDTMVICNDEELIPSKISKYGKAYYNGLKYLTTEEAYTDSIDSSNFVDDEKYVVQEGDTIKSIANRYHIWDYKSLGRFNNLNDSFDLTVGSTLIIPSEYGKPIVSTEAPYESMIIDESTDSSSYKKVNEDIYYKGIDVSEHQGVIDWDVVQSKVDFVIVRMADTCNKNNNGEILLDSFYRENMQACQEKGIATGIYVFTRAHTENEMQKEIEFVLDNLKDEEGNYYNITRPIYIDVEAECGDKLYESEEARQNEVRLIKMFCDAMASAGYASGIYINSSAVPKINELAGDYSIWAGGGSLAGYLYNVEQTIDNMYYGYHNEKDYFTSNDIINVVQTSSHGEGKDVGVSSTYIDLDYADKEYFDYLDKVFENNQKMTM